jgi:hypothetical protein
MVLLSDLLLLFYESSRGLIEAVRHEQHRSIVNLSFRRQQFSSSIHTERSGISKTIRRSRTSGEGPPWGLLSTYTPIQFIHFSRLPGEIGSIDSQGLPSYKLHVNADMRQHRG